MRLDAAGLAARFGSESVGELGPSSTRPARLASLPVVSPPTLDAACEALRFAASEGLRILPAGAGEHLHLVRPGGHFDFILSTRRLQRVVEYEPAEMVLVAEAGLTLRELETLTAAQGQRLGPDPWPARAATLGGAVAGDRSGLARLSRGTLRDAVLGARVLHADGSVSKTGGKVVKNVAGYDLAKLYIGARGALVLTGEINLRLVPRPETAALVVAEVERQRAGAALLDLHRSDLAPTAMLVVAGELLPGVPIEPDRAVLVVRFEGREAAVQSQLESVRRRCGWEACDAEQATPLWTALQESLEPNPESVLIRITSLPIAVCDGLEAVAQAANLRRFVGQFGVGVSRVHLGPSRTPELRLLRERIEARGGRMEIEFPAGTTSLDAVIPDPVLAGLDGRIDAAFDPGHRFAPRRAAGGTA